MFRGATGTIYTPIDGSTPQSDGQTELIPVRDPQGEAYALRCARRPADSPYLLRMRARIEAQQAASPAAATWLVTPIDHGEADGRAFFVLRQHPASLEDWRQSDPPLPARLQQAAALCRFVGRCEADGGADRVYLDIRPANLLLDPAAPEGLRLASLGEPALRAPLDPTHTPYAPPERALPQGQPAGALTDRFSTAVTVYALITGALPLRAAPQLWTDAGLTLCSLQHQRLAGDPLDGPEEAERARLAAQPLTSLLRPDCHLLTPNFDRRLRSALGSSTMATLLTRSLRDMLSALPEDRLTQPAALAPLLDALAADPPAPPEAEGPALPLEAGPPRPASPATEFPLPSRRAAPQETVRPTRGRWGVAMAGLLSAGVGVTVVWMKALERAHKVARIWNEAPAGPRTEAADLVWIEVPAGRGQIGDDIDGHRSDTPAFLVQFTAPFAMLETEVTNRQYARLVPDHQPVNDEPVAKVTWQAARSWCVQAGGRLPTELEWEYAARGGGSGPYGRGQGGWRVTEDNIADYAWTRHTNKAQAVRQKAPNAWGLYDLWGNLSEWTLDGYENTAWNQRRNEGDWNPDLGFSIVTDPGVVDTIDRAPPEYRVYRGGSALDWEKHLRSSRRFGTARPLEHIGFRCVRGPDRAPVNLTDHD